MNDAARDPKERVRLRFAVPEHLGNVAVVITGALIFVIVIVMVSGVLARSVFHVGLPWTEELARILLVWVAFLGGLAATCRGGQIRVDSLPNWVRSKSAAWGRALDVLNLALALLAVGIWGTASLALFGPSAWATSPATGIPVIATRIALPIACVLIGIVLVLQFIRAVRGEPRYTRTSDLDLEPDEEIDLLNIDALIDADPASIKGGERP